MAYGAFNAAIGLAAPLPSSVLAVFSVRGVGPWHGFGPAAPFLFGASMAPPASVLLMTLVPEPRREHVEA